MDLFLLEDDAPLSQALVYSLERENFRVTAVRTVAQAMRVIRAQTFALYILDLMLPDGSGYDVCRAVRAQGDQPIIFLTACEEEVQVVLGFDLGADDYIVKPFRVRELQMRIRSVLRRAGQVPEAVMKVRDLTVRVREARVFRGEREILLTAMEYRLLLIFLQNRGQLLSRAQLLEALWDMEGDFVNDNTLTVYIKRLRAKIEEDPASPQIIKTVRGLGYQMEAQDVCG